jgi:hypothetical protein
VAVGDFAYNELLDRDAARLAYQAVLAVDPAHPEALVGAHEVALDAAKPSELGFWLDDVHPVWSDPDGGAGARRLALSWVVATLLARSEPKHDLALALAAQYPFLPALDFRGIRWFLGQRTGLGPAREKGLELLLLLERPGRCSDQLLATLGIPRTDTVRYE